LGGDIETDTMPGNNKGISEREKAGRKNTNYSITRVDWGGVRRKVKAIYQKIKGGGKEISGQP